MKDKSLIILKYTVILLNIILILGFIFFVYSLFNKILYKSKCDNYEITLNDINNAEMIYDDDRIIIVEKKPKNLYIRYIDSCNGEAINNIVIKSNDD